MRAAGAGCRGTLLRAAKGPPYWAGAGAESGEISRQDKATRRAATPRQVVVKERPKRMSPLWHIGQLVVCVDTDWLTPPQAGERFPLQGDVLTVWDIDPDQGFAPGEIGFRFEECVPRHGGWFLSRLFRPARLSSNDALRELRALLPNKRKPAREAADA